MKTRRKRKRRYVVSEEERRAEEHRAMVIPFLPALARTILYRAKVGNRDDPFAVAKYLAEEFRANPRLGVDRLADTLEVRWKQQDEADCFKFVGKMLKVLGEYLETEQPVFSKLDHGTIEIVMQHPCYTIKEITEALSKRHPRQKWDTLEKSVRRLLENVQWQRYLKHFPFLKNLPVSFS